MQHFSLKPSAYSETVAGSRIVQVAQDEERQPPEECLSHEHLLGLNVVKTTLKEKNEFYFSVKKHLVTYTGDARDYVKKTKLQGMKGPMNIRAIEVVAREGSQYILDNSCPYTGEIDLLEAASIVLLCFFIRVSFVHCTVAFHCCSFIRRM